MLTINQFWHVRLAIFALLLSGMFCWSAENVALAGNTDPWKVVEVKGAAEYNQGGSGWRSLKTGVVFKAGSRVRTGPGGRVVMTRPGDSVSVSPNSRFRIPVPDGNGQVAHFFQSLGTLLFKVKTRPQNPFNVKTPYLAAVIKGTTFTVSVGTRNATLHVSTGAVQVTSIMNGATVLVHPGHTAIVDARNKGKINLIGAGRDKPKKKSENSSRGAQGAIKTAVAKSSGKGNLIPRRMGGHKIDIAMVTGGLVRDGSKAPNAGKGNSSGRVGGGASSSGGLGGGVGGGAPPGIGGGKGKGKK